MGVRGRAWVLEWTPLVLMLGALILGAQLLGPSGALGTASVAVAGAIGWVTGRAHQRAADRREQLLSYLETFTSWAERELASTPDDLDEAGEALRAELRQEYQTARRTLRRYQ